ncbi:MAG: c-type cytochrome [Erythrobacter sp.]|nr:MAG: c-type cytochrome [Erythrobacter sp.]
MRNILRFSAAPALALVLAACGGDAEEADAPADAAGETAETPLAEGAVAPVGADSAAATGTEAEATGEAGEPTPTPSVSASASAAPTPRPTPTPTRVAVAATPPAAFATCGVCHSVAPGQNGIGPSLAGVVGRRAGSVAGANYSPAMQAANLTWTEANLERYLADPGAVVPGTTMPNPGANPAARQAIIDYLKTL